MRKKKLQVEVKMPDVSTTGTEITILQWLVGLNGPVKRGQPLLEVETDKATMEVEAASDGTLKKVLVQSGDEVHVGQVIAVIERGQSSSDTTTKEVQNISSEAAADTTQQRKLPVAPVKQLNKPVDNDEQRGFFAKNRQTVQRAATQDSFLLTTAQKVVARRMQQSKQTVPHFYLQTSVNAEPMAARREASSKRIAWDAFFVKAVGKALTRFDRMCCRFEDGKLVSQGSDAVGVAVSVDDDLYVVPIDTPAAKSVEQITDEIHSEVERINQGDPEARSIRPANITVSNLGASNVESFTAVVNPPEAAILAIGRVKPQAVEQDDQVIVQRRVSVVLSVDHRVVNGKYAADFLSHIAEELESP